MTTRPRILILTTAFLPHIGGSELAIHHIGQRLDGFDIDVVTGRLDGVDVPTERMGRLTVIRAGGRWSRLALFLPKALLPIAMAVTALRLMRRHDYRLVHAYQASQAAGAAWLIKLVRPSVPLILTLQEGKELSQQNVLVRVARALLIRRADVVTAISQHLAAYARRYTSAPIYCIPNGVDVEQMQSVTAVRRAHDILTISRLVEKNNVANLIRAMVHVRVTFPDARLIIAGDGPLRSSLAMLVAECRVADAVEFRGSVAHQDVALFLASAGVFARPSLSEGLGNVFLEAMAARVPVVASAVGGIPDIVHDGETGLWCDPRDPKSIADALIRILTDAELYRRLVTSGEALVRSTYDWSRIAQRMARLYADIDTCA